MKIERNTRQATRAPYMTWKQGQVFGFETELDHADIDTDTIFQ